MNLRKRIKAIPKSHMPDIHRWSKSYGDEKEYEITEGIPLKRFGFNYFIPNFRQEDIEEFGFKPVIPEKLNQELFFHDGNKIKSKTFVGYVWIRPVRMIMSQLFVDGDRLLEYELKEHEEHYKEPVKLSLFGDYFWCSDGTHRIVYNRLKLKRTFAEINLIEWK